MLTDEQLLVLLRQQPSQKFVVLALLMATQQPATTTSIRARGVEIGFREVQAWNLSRILRKAAGEGFAAQLPDGWKLLPSARELLKTVGVPFDAPLITEIRHDLGKHLDQISDKERRRFLEEAIGCFDARHSRAAIVLAWVGAAYIIQNYVTENYLKEFNAAGATRFGKDWKEVRTIKDFDVLREGDLLQLCQDASIISKAEKLELQARLDLRNRCGHPNPLVIEEHVAASHLATLLKNVYARY